MTLEFVLSALLACGSALDKSDSAAFLGGSPASGVVTEMSHGTDLDPLGDQWLDPRHGATANHSERSRRGIAELPRKSGRNGAWTSADHTGGTRNGEDDSSNEDGSTGARSGKGAHGQTGAAHPEGEALSLSRHADLGESGRTSAQERRPELIGNTQQASPSGFVTRRCHLKTIGRKKVLAPI